MIFQFIQILDILKAILILNVNFSRQASQLAKLSSNFHSAWKNINMKINFQKSKIDTYLYRSQNEK